MMQIFDKKSLNFVESVAKVDMMDAIKRLKKSRQSFVENKLSKTHQKWSPFPAHVVKVQADVAIRCNENIVDLGAVVKDLDNKIIVAAIQQIQIGGDVKYLAVEAIKRGFQAARNTKFQCKAVETDC